MAECSLHRCWRRRTSYYFVTADSVFGYGFRTLFSSPHQHCKRMLRVAYSLDSIGLHWSIFCATNGGNGVWIHQPWIAATTSFNTSCLVPVPYHCNLHIDIHCCYSVEIIEIICDLGKEGRRKKCGTRICTVLTIHCFLLLWHSLHIHWFASNSFRCAKDVVRIWKSWQHVKCE